MSSVSGALKVSTHSFTLTVTLPADIESLDFGSYVVIRLSRSSQNFVRVVEVTLIRGLPYTLID